MNINQIDAIVSLVLIVCAAHSVHKKEYGWATLFALTVLAL